VSAHSCRVIMADRAATERIVALHGHAAVDHVELPCNRKGKQRLGTVMQSVRMDERTKAELATLSEATGRSLNYLVRNPGLKLLGLWKG
jgi:hypothetical protein